ncbi:chemotaxis protein CheD [Granulosicoccaceae sp. 1_MG-2023]|nr:chemotaxis protein CheD [Granulosicoccaceae sp. 1_MG-2023]
MSQKIIIVGEYVASADPSETLKTFALGSCLAIVLLDPATRTVGMLHPALPDAAVAPEKAVRKPAYFVNTGIAALLELMQEMGCAAGGRGMVCKMAGGAAMLGQNDTFNVGERNVAMALSQLKARGIRLVAQDTGQSLSRTTSINVGTARLEIASPGMQNRCI